MGLIENYNKAVKDILEHVGYPSIPSYPVTVFDVNRYWKIDLGCVIHSFSKSRVEEYPKNDSQYQYDDETSDFDCMLDYRDYEMDIIVDDYIYCGDEFTIVLVRNNSHRELKVFRNELCVN